MNGVEHNQISEKPSIGFHLLHILPNFEVRYNFAGALKENIHACTEKWKGKERRTDGVDLRS